MLKSSQTIVFDKYFWPELVLVHDAGVTSSISKDLLYDVPEDLFLLLGQNSVGQLFQMTAFWKLKYAGVLCVLFRHTNVVKMGNIYQKRERTETRRRTSG